MALFPEECTGLKLRNTDQNGEEMAGHIFSALPRLCAIQELEQGTFDANVTSLRAVFQHPFNYPGVKIMALRPAAHEDVCGETQELRMNVHIQLSTDTLNQGVN